MSQLRLTSLVKAGVIAFVHPDNDPNPAMILPKVSDDEWRGKVRLLVREGSLRRLDERLWTDDDTEWFVRLSQAIDTYQRLRSFRLLATGRVVTEYVDCYLNKHVFSVEGGRSKLTRLRDALSDAGFDVKAYLAQPK